MTGDLCLVPDCDRKPHRRGYCHAHNYRLRKHGDVLADKPLRRYWTAPPLGRLWCRTCLQAKPDSDMTNVAWVRSRSYKSSLCKDCNRDKQRVRTPESRRREHLQGRYQISPDEYDKLLDGQDGVCAICGRSPQKNNLAVDHDRSCCSGKGSCGNCIRGLLCSRCNQHLEWWITYRDNIAPYLGGSSSARITPRILDFEEPA